MDEEKFLNGILWLSVLISMPLLIVSLMAVGKHFAELQYQILRQLNGIRRIQSHVNLRTHGNRTIFALVYIVVAISGLFSVDMELRSWISRILFLLLLVAFTVSALLDWHAEHAQLRILLHFEDVNNISRMRNTLHTLNNRIGEYWGLASMLTKNTVCETEMETLQGEIQGLLQSIQFDLHSMDPSYMHERGKLGAHSEDQTTN